MLKISYCAILGICFMFRVGLLGNASDYVTQFSETAWTTGIISAFKFLEQIEMGDSLSGVCLNTINYDQYLKKIWIIKNWNGIYDTNYPISFYITE